MRESNYSQGRGSATNLMNIRVKEFLLHENFLAVDDVEALLSLAHTAT